MYWLAFPSIYVKMVLAHTLITCVLSVNGDNIDECNGDPSTVDPSTVDPSAVDTVANDQCGPTATKKKKKKKKTHQPAEGKDEPITNKTGTHTCTLCKKCI